MNAGDRGALAALWRNPWSAGEARAISQTVKLARRCHRGQTDRQGRAYWTHPYRVMLRCQSYRRMEMVQTALLHDVLEDCDVSCQDLKALGLCSLVLESVSLLTRRKPADYRKLSAHEQFRAYAEYIDTIARSGNVVAATVKLADLADNSVPSRIGALSDRHRHRYEWAYNQLSARVDASRIIRADVKPL